jgi:predicted RNA-binding protein with PIN domain
LRYLIDGYNLFFKLKEEILPLEEKRNEFIALLDEEVGDLHLNAFLIFDSHIENSHDYASKRTLKHLEISFSPKNLSADHYILELLEWSSKNTTLVTSDKSLGVKAKHLGAKVKTIEAFVEFILKKRKQKKPRGKVEMKETDANIKRYLEAFEKSDGSLEEF